jgi:hypothetical protein
MPLPDAGTPPTTPTTGGSSGFGGSSAGGSAGSGGSQVDGGGENDSDAGLEELPALRVDDLLPCRVLEPVSIAGEARGDAALALDEGNVYYVSLRGVATVPKEGGEVRVLGPADDTHQVAVDAENVYFGGRSFWRVPKAGGDATLLLDGQVIGVVGSGDRAYFTNFGLTPTSLQSWSESGGFEMVDRFTSQLWVPQVLADDTFVYVTPAAMTPALDLLRVRMSDKTVETLTSADTVRGVALGGGNLYFSEEATRSVKVVHLDDLTTETVLQLEDYPTGLAADESHVYLNLQVILPGGTKYHGHLIRFGSNGEGPCELSTSIEYGPSVTVDDAAVYWIGERHLWKATK